MEVRMSLENQQQDGEHDNGSAWVYLPEDKKPVRATSVAVIGAPGGVFESGVSNER
jgi:hypothetical protein